MGVKKFRDIREVTDVPASPDPTKNLRLAFELSSLGLKLSRRPAFRGIQRYRSIEEASRDDPEVK